MSLTSGLLAFFLFALTEGMSASGAVAGSLPLPDWTSIFRPDGTVVDLRGGLDAVFLEDKISAGLAVDMTVLTDPGDKSVVDNGIVDPAHDVGNGYVWVTADSAGDWLLYAGVERLSSLIDTFVEFEFNQAVRQVGSGAPWHVRGERMPGDLLIRVNFKAGEMDSTEFQLWNGTGFQTIAISGPSDCGRNDYWSCSGTPPMQSTQEEAWDEEDNLVQVPQPDRFVMIGANLASLLGSNVEFTSIQVRTPEDIILNSFGRIGLWAHGGAARAIKE